MYRVMGAVEVPGPPPLRASRLSKTLSVALRLKMIDESRIGSDSGTHNVIMTLQVTSYDPSTGVAKIINSGGTGNCGISSAAVYVYAY